jgi:hypothetical protein
MSIKWGMGHSTATRRTWNRSFKSITDSITGRSSAELRYSLIKINSRMTWSYRNNSRKIQFSKGIVRCIIKAVEEGDILSTTEQAQREQGIIVACWTHTY